MIRDARQLKAKIQQLTKSDSQKSQIYLRNFFMERFLERISQSPYQKKFLLKGGLLIASLVGLDLRSTMDIDSTIKNLSFNEKEAVKIIRDIMETPLDDHVVFDITKHSSIMGEHDYPGFRFMLQGSFDGIRQAIRIDLTTEDIITPRAVSYGYRLMFENRIIKLMTYNLETLLAEKLETMIARGTANTRMRDFYDIYLLTNRKPFDLSTSQESHFKYEQEAGNRGLAGKFQFHHVRCC